MFSELEIRHNGRAQVIRREEVYFPFASGRLTYDCLSCPVPCCRRGFAYWTNSEAERLTQLSASPYLRFFLEPGHFPGYEKITAQPPGCFFLTDGGLCSIHLEQGGAKKPLTCQLFPFNRMMLVADQLVVGPKASLCPFQVTAQGKESALSNHDDLFDTMAREGMDRLLFPGTGIVADVPALLALERRVVDLSEEYLGSETSLLSFIDDQCAVARETSHPTAGLDADVGENNREPAHEMIRLAATALGVSESELHPFHPDVRHSIVALTPAMRSALALFQTDGPRVREGGLVSLDRIPAAILAVAVLAHLAKLAGMSAVTLQTVWNLFKGQRTVVWALAHLDAVPSWGGEALDDRAFIASQRSEEGPFGEMAAALLPGRQRGARIRLIDLLQTYGGELRPIDKVRFLRESSQRMYTRVVV